MTEPALIVIDPFQSIADLEAQLEAEEIGFEIVSFGVGRQNGAFVNFALTQDRLTPMTPLVAKAPAAGGQADEPFLSALVAGGFTIISGTYSAVIGGNVQDLVICRPGGLATDGFIERRGKMSFFGGPSDTGVQPTEGLALVELSEMGLYDADMFLTPGEAHAPGLARRLNPKKPYIACRWTELGLPTRKFRKFLQQSSIEVESVATGAKLIGVRAVDEGPGVLTRICDLSPALEGALNLNTDDEVIIRIPRPPQTGADVLAHRDNSDPVGGMSQRVPIPTDINPGLHAVTAQEMIAKLGIPGLLTRDCSEPSAELRPRIKNEVNVGPFTVSGLDVAIDSLQQIFAELKQAHPDVFAQVSTEDLGMLCVRRRRPAPDLFSNHSWGTAIDLKFGPQEVDQGVPETQRGFLALYPIFNRFGWFWGAGFSGSATDSMHFELSKEAIDRLPG